MRLSPRTLARVAAVALVAAAIAMAAIRTGGNGPAQDIGSVRVHPRPDDPLAAELVRCRDFGRAALEDEACMHTWDDNRDRFLGSSGPGGE